jgi:ribosomal protein S12 methylthiotransferase accessory factor
MEAVEIAVAEGLSEARLAVSKSSLRDFQNGTHLYDASRLLPPGQQLDPDRPIRWLRGEDLHTGRRILLPQDAVDLDAERSDIPGICKHSSGLASGNDRDEATFHAICELIERDGTSLWSLLGQEQKLGTCFSASSLGDAEVSWLYQVITDSGYRLSLFDQTSNLGVPVVMAVLGPADQVSVGETEITSGYGCHPVGAIAALRAITEAAQGRVTAIASTRDDIDQSSFGRRAPTAHLELLRATPCRRAPRDTKIGLTGMLGAVKTALGINGCVASMISLAPASLPFSVVRVLCFDLEDRSANVNWRPGRRAFEYVEQNLR